MSPRGTRNYVSLPVQLQVKTDKRTIPAKLVIVAVGVRPNTELASAAGLELGTSGAIAVNEYLQTSDPDIYAGHIT